MENNPKGEKPKNQESPEEAADDFDLDLDQIEEEIIDLVEVVDEEVADPGEMDAVEVDEPGAEADDEPFALEDFEIDAELEVESSGPEPVVAPLESADEQPGELEQQEDLTGGPSSADDMKDLQDLGEGFEDLEADRALAELFASDELDVSRLLDEAESPVEEGAETSGSETSGDFFSGLQPAEAPDPAGEGQLSEDLFADLEGMEPGADEEADAQGEFSEDLFSDLEMTGVDAAEEQLSEEPPSSPDEAGEQREAPATAEGPEELAALIGKQVEAAVTRLVEERLPAIAERIIREEIEKLKAEMD